MHSPITLERISPLIFNVPKFQNIGFPSLFKQWNLASNILEIIGILRFSQCLGKWVGNICKKKNFYIHFLKL